MEEEQWRENEENKHGGGREERRGRLFYMADLHIKAAF